jgi:hypothetical protein
MSITETNIAKMPCRYSVCSGNGINWNQFSFANFLIKPMNSITSQRSRRMHPSYLLVKIIRFPICDVLVDVIGNGSVFVLVAYDMIMETGLPGKINFMHGCIFFYPGFIPTYYGCQIF